MNVIFVFMVFVLVAFTLFLFGSLISGFSEVLYYIFGIQEESLFQSILGYFSVILAIFGIILIYRGIQFYWKKYKGEKKFIGIIENLVKLFNYLEQKKKSKRKNKNGGKLDK